MPLWLGSFPETAPLNHANGPQARKAAERRAGATLTTTRGKAAGSAVTPPTATLTILRNRGANH
jgi:hypothetical protein